MATGIEIAGLILGALPLLVSALEHYDNGLKILDRAWRYKRELASVKRLLLAEQTVFQNTCERLWIDLVSSDELDELLHGTKKGELKRAHELEGRVESRLGTSYKTYFSAMSDMAAVVSEIQEELGMDQEGQIQPSLVADISQRLKLSLFRDRIEESMKRLEKNNNILMSLTAQSIELEPLRKRKRGAAKPFVTVRDQACSLYNAIRASAVCHCFEAHEVRLTLENRVSHLTFPIEAKSWEATQLDANPLRFQMSFLSAGWPTKSQWSVEKIHILQYKAAASSVDTSVSNEPKNPVALDHTPRTDKTSSKGSKRNSLKAFLWNKSKKNHSVDEIVIPETVTKAVKFEIPGAKEQVTASSTGRDPNTEISNLCESLKRFYYSYTIKQNSLQDQTCIGFISGNGSLRFALSSKQAVVPGKSLSEGESSLFDALSSQRSNSTSNSGHALTEPLSHGKRLQLASVLASSVLQLYDTPWLPTDWSNKDVVLGNITLESNPDETGIFISSKLANKQSTGDPNANPPATFPGLRNATIFTLGLVLVELCFWKPMSVLRSPEDTLGADGRPNVLTHWSTATRLLLKIAEENGVLYADVVRRCIYCDFDQRSASLDNADFAQAFYDGVVEPLAELSHSFNRF